MKGAKSPAPTARLRRAASPSGEVVFYTGGRHFFAKKRPRGLKIRVVYAIIGINARGRNPPFPLLWHWKRFDPFPFKHTRASPPPSGKPHPPPAPAAAARTAEYENPPTNPYVPPNPFVGADAYIGPRSMHRFYGNLRRMRNCPLRRPPPQPAPPNTKIPRRIRMYPQIRL